MNIDGFAPGFLGFLAAAAAGGMLVTARQKPRVRTLGCRPTRWRCCLANDDAASTLVSKKEAVRSGEARLLYLRSDS